MLTAALWGFASTDAALVDRPAMIERRGDEAFGLGRHVLRGHDRARPYDRCRHLAEEVKLTVAVGGVTPVQLVATPTQLICESWSIASCTENAQSPRDPEDIVCSNGFQASEDIFDGSLGNSILQLS
jgi:hypothetical protein